MSETLDPWLDFRSTTCRFLGKADEFANNFDDDELLFHLNVLDKRQFCYTYVA